MEEPEQLGRLASHMKPTERQHLKESSKKIQEEEAMAKKKKISHKQQRSGGRYNHLHYELERRGNPPNALTHESLVRCIVMGIILLISGAGEFIFTNGC